MSQADVAMYLALDDDELLMEIARLSDPRAPLHSPGAMVAKGRDVFDRQIDRIRAVVCPRADLLDAPEFELATVIVGALLDHLTLGLASAVAAYAARRGVRSLCAKTATS